MLTCFTFLHTFVFQSHSKLGFMYIAGKGINRGPPHFDTLKG